ncbi:MAG: hypothetical protein IT410_04105 [Candidatus Doudnabacteria bacterium]|nr:hypothetical protein [Candidatus Doudnabacteria bacterium]
MKKLIKRSFLNALGTGAYVATLVTLMLNGEKIFGTINNMFAPIAFLLVFVISASITSGLVLGKPILMYVEGQKVEAIKLFIYTIGWLIVFALIVLALGLNI